MHLLQHCCLIIALVWTSPSNALEIPITVTEPAGIARTNEPISGGIPLPADTFSPGAANFALYRGGKQIPLQTSELVIGPKGFLRWILLDFQLDLNAGETVNLTLKTAKPIPPANPLKVTQTEDAIKVDTGRIQFQIAKKKPFGLVESLTADNKPILNKGRISYVDAIADKRYYAGVPETVNIHYAGPMRVTIEIRGKFQDDRTAKLAYCTYVTAWAGRTDILVRHSLINSRRDQMRFAKIKSSQIELRLSKAAETIVAGAEKPVTVEANGEIILHQGLEERRNRDLPSCKLTRNDKLLWSGRSAAGWISTGTVLAIDRLFRTDPPRALASRDGAIILEAAAQFFPGKKTQSTIIGRPWASQDTHRWLYDCSHHSSEYRIDFAPSAQNSVLAHKADAAAARIWALAPGDWYSRCDVLGVGKFGTIADEAKCHAEWGWSAGPQPQMNPNPRRFVAYEDNHYESESDSAEALLLMFLRTQKRGFFDEAEAWVRYHTDLQTWRTENWFWKDGGIWFPQGGPPGNRPIRKKADIDFERWNKGTDADKTLWRLAMTKSCYCHFYGAGLVDWFCLTGDREALLAAIDNCETKLDEFTHYRNFVPGKSNLGSTRGFGRGFYVAVRTWMVRPNNPILKQLVDLCRNTFAALPDEYLDERGVYAPVANKHPERYLTDGIKKFMAREGITVDKSGVFHDKTGNQWKWRDIGGTWMIAYIQHACNLLAEHTGDEDLMDYVIASGNFTAKYMLSPSARQTAYYAALDIPQRGEIWDEWKYDGKQRNELGEGPKHSGWYTRFFPDCCARAYTWTGETHLLQSAKEFWSFGNRRRYQTTKLTEKHHFANHIPPKDDSVLSTVRLFHESSHPRADTTPPPAIEDLSVRRLENGKAEISFTAPRDLDGSVVKYQVKVADMPILPYEKWIYARDSGAMRNWWRATNCTGEPKPKQPLAKEKFIVSNVPDQTDKPLFFAVRTFDETANRSPLSNVFTLQQQTSKK